MIAIRHGLHALTCLLVATVLAAASDLSDDLSARRLRLLERLGPDAILVVTSAPARRYSLDIDYEYRQDSNLYYLTGIAQPETMLILLPGGRARRELLFVKDQDPSREHWTGHLLTRAEATARSGIQTVFATSQFDDVVSALLSRRTPTGVDPADTAPFFDALSNGRARLALPLEIGRSGDPLTPTQDLARRLRERFVGFQTVDATPTLSELRVIKTPFEQQVLRKAADISADAHLAGMRAARPGAYEYEVRAAIEAVQRTRGALSTAYPSIVGSGPNATTLHYSSADRQMRSGDLLLVDAACNYEYMAPDITRTYPVNGTFSAEQRALYEIVLQAQDAALAVATPRSSLADIHNKAVDVIKSGLLKLGLITDTSGNQYRLWFTHGATHYIGIDVHDVGDNRRGLQPGMAFTIEPGLYIRQSALDALPLTPENISLIKSVQPMVQKYEGLGVRVEDSFIVDVHGTVQRLSSAVPRAVEAVEAFLRSRPASTGASR
ncbi:MAG: aminopeptidase P family protein [Vicinamibacterales bacterium]